MGASKLYLIKSILLLVLLSFLTGCSSLFLQPDRVDYTAAWKDRDHFVKQGTLPSLNGKILSYWITGSTAPHPQAVVIQFHGNAQNVTAHALNVGWLSEHNMHVISIDYQGFGHSEGKASIANSLEDVMAGIQFAVKYAAEKNAPLVFYGQSLGGDLLLKVLKDHPGEWSPKLVVLESSFYSYPMIGREKLSAFFLTWPLQWMAYVLLPSKYNPAGPKLAELKGMNFLLIHSLKDPIVPYHHSELLFKDLPGPDKELWPIPEIGHISFAYANKGKYREEFLKKLDKALKK